MTCDDDMLWLPEVIAVVEQTGMSIVVCESVGDDPVAATGLLLTHLRRVAKRFYTTKPQVWRLKATEQRPVKFSEHRDLVEKRSGRRLASYRLTAQDLQTPLL